jgi:hypothetical protein
MKVVKLQKLFNFVVDNFLFEFVYRLKQTIYTQMVVICGQKSYKVDTKHAIGRVIVDGTREGEVDDSIYNNRVPCEFCAKIPRFTTETGEWSGVSENRFSLAVELRKPPVEIDFHWRSLVTRQFTAPSTDGYKKCQ